MNDTNSPPKTPPKTKAFVRALPLGFIFLAAIFGTYFLRDYLSFEMFAENHDALRAFRDQNYALTLLIFILTYAIIVGFGLPGASLATLTGGFLFATFPGALYNVIAATLGAMAIFGAVRWGAGQMVERRLNEAGEKVQKIKRGLDENQWSMLFVVRFVPIVPFFLANLVLPFLGVSFFRYALSTFLGIIPGAVVYTSVGAGLSEVIARGERPDLSIIFEAKILLPLLGLAALSLLPVIIKFFRKTSAQE